MKIIVITNNLQRASFRQRIEVHLDALKAAGIDCTVEKLPAGELARRTLFGRTGDFDAVLLQKKTLNLLDARWLRRGARRIIYDLDDAIMYSAENPQHNSRSHLVPFRRTAAMADLVIAGNEYLAEHARAFTDNVHVLATGLDTAAYEAGQPADDGRTRLVWIGSRSTLRYLRQLTDALNEIGSSFDNVVLRMICDEFFDLDNMPVDKIPWSAQTQYSDLATADIGLAPLADNRFTRGKCGFKILQYSAASLPTITSPVGVNTEYVTDGVTGLHATTTDQWVAAMAELIEKAELRKQMGSKAAESATQFDLTNIADGLVDLVKKTLSQPEP